MTLVLGTGGCPKSSETNDTPAPAEEKSLPAKQLDDAKKEIDAANKAIEVKANQVGEGSIAK